MKKLEPVENLEPFLENLVETVKALEVKNCLELGQKLLIAKMMLPHNSWSPFVKCNLNMSMKHANVCINLCKCPINEQYYKKGLEWVSNAIKNNVDLEK